MSFNMKTKKLLSKTKRIVISTMAAVCALSSVAAISAGAVSDKCPVNLQNGYKHELEIDFRASSGTSTFRLSNGVSGNIKNSITAIEYTSTGTFVRNVSSNAAKEYTSSRTCTVSRKSGTSNVLKNYDGIGYNYTSTAKSRVAQSTYFCAVEIGSHGIETRLITP